MLSEVGHSIPFWDRNWFDGAAVAVVGASWEIYRKYAARKDGRLAEKLFNEGVDEVPGLIAKVETAPVRLARTEQMVNKLDKTISRLADAHVDLTTRVEDIGTKVDLLFENGNNTTNPGDLIALVAKRLGVYPKEDGSPPARRATDPLDE
jgi:hypothetical protein